MGKYDDIIEQERPYDAIHPPMTEHNRAAQFAPFDALTGFGGRIQESARLTQPQTILSEEQKWEINQSLQFLQGILPERPVVEITYFVPDGKKTGGHYQSVHSRLLKIKEAEGILLLEPELQIEVEKIFQIACDAKGMC